MTSLEQLCKLSASARSEWDVTKRVLPRCPMDPVDRIDLVKQIGARLEATAATGIRTASLAVKFDMDGLPIQMFLNSNDVTIKLPECYWKWWNEIEHTIQRYHPNKDPEYLNYLYTMRKLWRAYALDAFREVINAWKRQSDVPVFEATPEKSKEEACAYVFDWSKVNSIN